ncbi:retrovirus-related pol polyprotein from transposon TNT 1-94 [Tanacetum coccineum]
MTFIKAWKKEAIWLTGLLEELSVKLKSMAVNCDNQDAIHLSRNHVFHERTKHINVRYYFIIEVLEAKTVEVLKVGTEHNVVDALTKVVAGHKLLGVAECEYEELPDGETEIVPLACHLGHDIQIQSGREELCLIIGLSRLVSTFGGQDMALKELMQKNAVHNEMYNKMNTFMLDMQLGMMPPDQRNVLWSSQYRSSHNSDVGGVILNVMNQERREVHPSMYVLSPYTLLLPTTILPKKWGDKSRNKGMNANVAPFNLGKAVVDDNVVDEEVPITGERDTNDYIFYENMDPSKVRREHYIEPHGARFTVAKSGTTSLHPRSNRFIIEMDPHIIGRLDGSTRPYPSWDDVDWVYMPINVRGNHWVTGEQLLIIALIILGTFVADDGGGMNSESLRNCMRLDDEVPPIEAIIATLESELKLVTIEISKFQYDNKALDRLSKSMVTSLLEAEKICIRIDIATSIVVADAGGGMNPEGNMKVFSIDANLTQKTGGKMTQLEWKLLYLCSWYANVRKQKRQGVIHNREGSLIETTSFLDALCGLRMKPISEHVYHLKS